MVFAVVYPAALYRLDAHAGAALPSPTVTWYRQCAASESCLRAGIMPMSLRVEQAIVGLLLMGFVVFGAARAQSRGLRRDASPPSMLVWIALSALVVGVRLWMPPALIHANFHGYSLLEGILQFPAPSEFRASYGQGSFFVLGLTERLFGGGWETIVRTNAIVGALTVIVGARLAERAAGFPAGWITLAAGAMQPLLVRTAVSEDAHVLAAFFGMIALYVADTSRREGTVRLTDVGLVVCASVLAAFTRQTYAYWPLVTLVVAGAGRFRALAREPLVVTAFLVAMSLGVVRVAGLLQAHGDWVSYVGMVWFLPTAIRPEALALHPLLRPSEGLVLLPLFAIGTACAIRRRDPGLVAIAVGATFGLLASMGMSFVPSPGVSYAFRVPPTVLLLPLAGAGGAAIWQWGGRSGGLLRGATLAAALVVLLAIPVPTLVEIAARPDPLTQELVFLTEHVGELPAGARLWFPRLEPFEPPADSGAPGTYPPAQPPSYRLSRVVWARELDVDHAEPEATGDVWFLQGVGCWAYSAEELFPRPVEALVRRARQGTVADRARWLVAASGEPERWLAEMGASVPVGMRPECRAAAARGAQFVEWGRITVHEHELPFAYFGASEFPIGVWHIPASTDAPGSVRAGSPATLSPSPGIRANRANRALDPTSHAH